MNTILTVDNKLSTWLVNQLNDRNWSHRELGRRAGVSGAAVSRVISGEQNPGADFCAKIAKALGEPQDKIFRLAGLLSSNPGPARCEDELLAVFRQLSEERQGFLLDAARGLVRPQKVDSSQEKKRKERQVNINNLGLYVTISERTPQEIKALIIDLLGMEDAPPPGEGDK